MYINIKTDFMDDLRDMKEKAQEIANILQINVSFKFNGILYTIEPTTEGK